MGRVAFFVIVEDRKILLTNSDFLKLSGNSEWIRSPYNSPVVVRISPVLCVFLLCRSGNFKLCGFSWEGNTDRLT